VTVAASLLLTLYMILRPAHWLKDTMELTHMDLDYRIFLIGLGLFYLGAAWVFQKYISAPMAKALGRLVLAVTGGRRQRKEYKNIREGIWASD
jgi:cation-transporting ATPase 13A3/4/5